MKWDYFWVKSDVNIPISNNKEVIIIIPMFNLLCPIQIGTIFNVDVIADRIIIAFANWRCLIVSKAIRIINMQVKVKTITGKKLAYPKVMGEI